LQYKKGLEITGLNTIIEDTILFHAGTSRENEKVVTNGGRVLCVTALSEYMDEAIYKTQELLSKVKYEGIYFRKDIGYEFKESFEE
jgi:phosphoribosylamine--glycine ligase